MKQIVIKLVNQIKLLEKAKTRKETELVDIQDECKHDWILSDDDVNKELRDNQYSLQVCRICGFCIRYDKWNKPEEFLLITRVT